MLKYLSKYRPVLITLTLFSILVVAGLMYIRQIQPGARHVSRSDWLIMKDGGSGQCAASPDTLAYFTEPADEADNIIRPIYFYSSNSDMSEVEKRCPRARNINWEAAIYALSDYMHSGAGSSNDNLGPAEIQRHFAENCEQDMRVYEDAIDKNPELLEMPNWISGGYSGANDEAADVDSAPQRLFLERPYFLSEDGLPEMRLAIREPLFKEIRDSLSSFKSNDQDWIKSHGWFFDGVPGNPNVLDELSGVELASRFVPLFLTDGIMGGLHVTLIFIDSPKRAYTAWLYPIGDGKVENWKLRGFFVNEGVAPDDIERFMGYFEALRDDPANSV